MLYQISDGTVSAGGEVILSHIDFEAVSYTHLAGADHFIVGRDLFQAVDRHEKVRELERIVGTF